MTRYAKQDDSYSCGANALANALKWDGHKVSWKKHKERLLKEAGTIHRYGTWPKDLLKGLRKHFGKRVRYSQYLKQKSPTMRIMDQVLDKKGLMILQVYWPKWHPHHGHSHYFLVDAKTDKGYYTINLKSAGKARRWISRKWMRKLLYNYKENRFFVIAPHPKRHPEQYKSASYLNAGGTNAV